jgi:phosphohistidine phosphatase
MNATTRTRRLWLIRHAEAGDASGSRDRGRRLTVHGEEQARRIGQWLATGTVRPDWIVSSDAQRATRTAELLAAALAADDAQGSRTDEVTRVLEPRLYDAVVDEVIAVLRELPPTQRAVVIVAHNPGLSDAAALLAGRPVRALSTAGVAEFEVPDDWPYLGAGSATLVRIISGQDLPPGHTNTGVVP